MVKKFCGQKMNRRKDRPFRCIHLLTRRIPEHSRGRVRGAEHFSSARVSANVSPVTDASEFLITGNLRSPDRCRLNVPFVFCLQTYVDNDPVEAAVKNVAKTAVVECRFKESQHQLGVCQIRGFEFGRPISRAVAPHFIFDLNAVRRCVERERRLGL